MDSLNECYIVLSDSLSLKYVLLSPVLLNFFLLIQAINFNNYFCNMLKKMTLFKFFYILY